MLMMVPMSFMSYNFSHVVSGTDRIIRHYTPRSGDEERDANVRVRSDPRGEIDAIAAAQRSALTSTYLRCYSTIRCLNACIPASLHPWVMTSLSWANAAESPDPLDPLRYYYVPYRGP